MRPAIGREQVSRRFMDDRGSQKTFRGLLNARMAVSESEMHRRINGGPCVARTLEHRRHTGKITAGFESLGHRSRKLASRSLKITEELLSGTS